MISSVVLLAILAVAAWAFWRRGARGIGFVIGLCAFVLAVGILRELPWPAYVAAGAVLLVVGLASLRPLGRGGDPVRRPHPPPGRGGVHVRDPTPRLRGGDAAPGRDHAPVAGRAVALAAAHDRRARGGGAAVPLRADAGVGRDRGRRARLRRPPLRQDRLDGRTGASTTPAPPSSPAPAPTC